MTNKLQARTVVKPMGDETNADEEGRGVILIHTELGMGFIAYSSKEDREEAIRFLDSLKAGENAVIKKEEK